MKNILAHTERRQSQHENQIYSYSPEDQRIGFFFVIVRTAAIAAADAIYHCTACFVYRCTFVRDYVTHPKTAPNKQQSHYQLNTCAQFFVKSILVRFEIHGFGDRRTINLIWHY